MAGNKNSGRKSWIAEVKIEEVCKLSVQVLKKFLKEEGLSLLRKAPIAAEIVKKYMPLKIKGEGFGTDIYNIINQIRQNTNKDSQSSLELDSRDGVDERRTRPSESDQEVPKQGVSEDNL